MNGELAPVTEVRRAPLALTAGKPRTLDAAKRTVEVVWTTGAAVRRRGRLPDGSYGEYMEELSLEPAHVDLGRMSGGAAPVLNAHNNWDLRDLIGTVRSASVDGRQGVATIEFSSRDDVEPIFRDVAAGIIRNVSVGYQVKAWEWSPAMGNTIPRARATLWEPMEISLVPMPADPGAQVRSVDPEPSPTAAGTAAQSERSSMAETVTTPAVDEAAIRTAAQEEARTAAQAQIQAERERISGITTVARKLKLGDAFMQQHIDAGTALDAVRVAAFDIVATRQEETPTHSQRAELVADEADKALRGMSDAILVRAGVAGLVTKHTGEKIDAGEFRGLSLLDMGRDCLERTGVRTRGMERMKLVGLAFTTPGTMARSAAQGTSDFAILLENTMHKVLLAAYATQPVVYTRFCRVGTVTDFRPHKRYRRGLLGSLMPINELGEFKRVAVPDGEKESITATTKGLIIALSRQTIINDDMGAFSDLATDAGRAASVTVENDVFALLALNAGTGPAMSDGVTMFHASHGNIGTAAISSVAAFEEIASLMRAQKDPAKVDFIDLRPSIWLGPVAKGFNARVLNAAEYDPDTVNKLQKPNSVRGMFDEIVDTPRLTGTRWYAFTNPAVAAAIEVAFLEGQAQPFLDSMDGWNVDGTEWKVRQDYGVAAIDWRAAATNAGA